MKKKKEKKESRRKRPGRKSFTDFQFTFFNYVDCGSGYSFQKYPDSDPNPELSNITGRIHGPKKSQTKIRINSRTFFLILFFFL